MVTRGITHMLTDTLPVLEIRCIPVARFNDHVCRGGVSALGVYIPSSLNPEVDPPKTQKQKHPWTQRQTPPAHCMLG